MYKNYADKKVFFLDLDGTVYLSDTLISGAKEAIEALRQNAKVFFLTNNSSKSRDTYAKKLTNLGIPTSREDIITSSGATAHYLKLNGIKEVSVLGTDGLKDELKENGINVVKSAKTAVLGFDTDLSYANLCAFCDLIRGGSRYIATHPDFNCPTKNGFIPDVGSFMALINASTGKKPEVICGKPNAIMAKYALSRAQALPSEAVMVGDRIYTDLKFGADNGISAALVLTGEGTREELASSGVTADVFNSLYDIVFYGVGEKFKQKLGAGLSGIKNIFAKRSKNSVHVPQDSLPSGDSSTLPNASCRTDYEAMNEAKKVDDSPIFTSKTEDLTNE